MPIGNGVGNLAQRVNFVPNPFVSIENRAAKMDLETVLLIPISPTMGSAKTGGDTFIVLGAISFWFDTPVCIQTIEWRAMSDHFHFLDISQFPRHVNRRTCFAATSRNRVERLDRFLHGHSGATL
jgi:hypothetical protein